MTRIALALALGLLAGCTADQPNKTAGPATGRWLTASGNLEIEIAPCGEALCGTVVKVLANNSMAEPGKTMAADTPSPLGMKIMTDFKPDGDGQWSGSIFNRENGKTYDCTMSILAQDQLKIRPYVLLPLFGKTQVWTRVVAGPSHS